MIFPLSVQLNQIIEFKERPRPDVPLLDAESARSTLDMLEATEREQEKLGLGIPEFSLYQERSKLEQAIVLDRTNRIAKFCKPIQEPSRKFFTRFTDRHGTRMEGFSYSIPKLIMVMLEKGISEAELLTEDDIYRTSIPLIPRTHLELAKRVKKIDPRAKFYLIYVPTWIKVEIEDPALVVESGEEWFQVGTVWAGDAEIIENFLQER